MSLTALPVSATDLTTLQAGVQFFTNPGQATSQAAAINAPGSTQSVFTYAASLIGANISFSQVAMAVGAIAEGGTLATSDLTSLSTQFLPNQVNYAAQLGLNQTVYAAQAVGLALAGTSGFQTTWGSLSGSAFVSSVAGATGVDSSAIATWLTNWAAFYTANGTFGGLSVMQAAYGATLGNAIGVALLNPTSANLESVFSTSGTGFSPNTGSGLVQNALIDVATGQYVVGASLAAQPLHTALQGQFTPPPPGFTLTTGVDTFLLNSSNSTVTGILGGAGATWTPGDTITAAAGLTNETFTLTGDGSTGVLDVTAVGPGNAVSGIQRVNLNSGTDNFGDTNQAFHGDFTSTGPEGAWTGLTNLTVTSAGGSAGVDVLTVGATTAVNISDTLFNATNAALTVNGGSTVTIVENNGGDNNGGITVNGVSGTTTVSVTQTQNGNGHDGVVMVNDVNWASTTVAGTITTVTLDGLSGHVTDNQINDNALTTLTVNNADDTGVVLDITNNLTTPTNTTLSLNLSHNGFDPTTGVLTTALAITDTNNEIATIHLGLGSQNSFVTLTDNGLVTLDTPTAGTGALSGVANFGTPSQINDNFAGVVTFDFSGLNGDNNIFVNRGATNNNDVYTLGNFGTDANTFIHQQQIGVDYGSAAPTNTVTFNFGSGAYNIFDASANEPAHAYVNTAPNGAGLANFNTVATWAEIFNSNAGDTLNFKGDSVQNIDNFGAVANLATGITTALLTAAHTAVEFQFGGDTYFFDHADASNTITAKDAMVQTIGTAYNASTLDASHIVHFA